jgi:hypothetical protein
MKNKAINTSSTLQLNSDVFAKETDGELQTFLGRPSKTSGLSDSTDTLCEGSQTKFLNKKRKISDLNFESAKRARVSDKSSPLVTTDTKITSYFNQKKSSSFKKSCVAIESIGLQDEGEVKMSCCKRLDFDSISGSDRSRRVIKGSPLMANFSDTPGRNDRDVCFKQPELTEHALMVIDKVAKVKKNCVFSGSTFKDTKLSFNLKDIRMSPKKYIHLDKIIDQYSMKDKYEGLINRELILPCHFKTLMTKFVKLDETIQSLRRNGQSRCLTNIVRFMKESFNLTLTVDEFQQMLFIVPHFYIYKWDRVGQQIDLFIDIPNDIVRRVDQVFDERVDFVRLQTYPYIPVQQDLTDDVKIKRGNMFKKILLSITNEEHKKFIKDKRILTKINPFKHRTWHSEFDVHGVQKIEKFEILPKPRI